MWVWLWFNVVWLNESYGWREEGSGCGCYAATRVVEESHVGLLSLVLMLSDVDSFLPR